MTSPYFIPVLVQEESQPGAARREAARIATLEGMSETDVGRVSVVVTEAANNVVKHGKGGEVLIRGSKENDKPVVEILALDKGKGMNDVVACMRDGYSTAGTPGTGLGAMQRMSDQIEIYSSPGTGTVVYCRVGGLGKPASRLDSGVVVVPVAGELRCGDSWAQYHTDTHSAYLVVDGLGHGPGAAEAADEAVAAFHRISTVNPVDALDEIHHSLRKTRGAAASIASIDHNARKVKFAGVGNVAAAVISTTKAHAMVSHNGILGHAVSRMQDFTYDWPPDGVLTMYSDGIASHWSLTKYPGLANCPPLLSSAVVYRDFSRRRDDATVLIARHRVARN
jgi:anti-sigma regulatory factor (Ser/Thr protein kinase)